MSEGRVQVVLDLYYELDEDEFRLETGTEKPNIEWSDIKATIIEQVEEAVKESSNGSSLQLSLAEENTGVKKW